jgi:hypothetical protein
MFVSLQCSSLAVVEVANFFTGAVSLRVFQLLSFDQPLYRVSPTYLFCLYAAVSAPVVALTSSAHDSRSNLVCYCSVNQQVVRAGNLLSGHG